MDVWEKTLQKWKTTNDRKADSLPLSIGYLRFEPDSECMQLEVD